MKVLYVFLGMILSFNLTLMALDPLAAERDKAIVRVQSLQSCYFASVRFAKMDPAKSEEFCLNHSNVTTETFKDIAVQMDAITDKQYSPWVYYGSKIKAWFKN